MVNYSLSEKAVSDIANAYEYGVVTFGLLQAQSYMLEMHERFQMLSDNPNFGRDASQLAERLRRFEYESHIIFYLPEDDDTLIVRVLGKKMDFIQHI